MTRAWLLNTAWMLACSREAARFHRATRRVAETQAEILAAILRANHDAQFGRRHCFARLRTPAEYQNAVPPSRYEDYDALISRIAAGAPAVLTSEPVTLLEPTSGTTGGEKLIPYTASLRKQFQRAVAAWIADLFQARPAVRTGRAYWSLSPALGPRRWTAGGIPIGFDDDTAYLGTLEQMAVRRLLVVPAGVTRLTDLDLFRYLTLFCLLRAADLALVSVWSPTFLTALFGRFEEWQDRLCADIALGCPRPPTPTHDCLLPRWKPDAGRAAALTAIFRSGATTPEKLRLAWPGLSLISCWADAGAARFLPELRGLFPGVEVQGKGLLATEGVVSLPLVGWEGAALAVRSHFFEFEETESPEGRFRLAHELDRGGLYRVMLTTGGGLYRYQLRDAVEVVGFYRRCPLLRFRGKVDRVSDLVGEKLAEVHVQSVLDRLFAAAAALQPSFALLVPVLGRPPRYRLYVQGSVSDPARLTAGLEAGLQENPYYRHAVAFGQLAPTEFTLLGSDGPPAWSIYERHCLQRGQRCGAVKPAALDAWTGWPELFEAGVRPP